MRLGPLMLAAGSGQDVQLATSDELPAKALRNANQGITVSPWSSMLTACAGVLQNTWYAAVLCSVFQCMG
jgi:hypothetical protein